MVVQRQQGRRGGAVVAAVAGSLVAGVVATGCSEMGTVAGSDTHPAADSRPANDSREVTGRDGGLEALRGAADVLVRSGSSKARTWMETVTGGTRVTIRGEGGFDYAKRIGRLRVVLPKDAAGAEEHRPIMELLAPGKLYMKDRGAGVPPDKWVRVDTTELADGNLVTGGATDPLSAAELLRGAREVTFVGEERPGGKGPVLRHYRGTADIARAAEKASPYARGALAAAAEGFSAGEVPFDAYLDEQGRLRKVRHRFLFTERRATDGSGAAGEAGGTGGSATAAGGEGVEVVSTTVLYGFGAAVDTGLPAERDIYAGKISVSGA